MNTSSQTTNWDLPVNLAWKRPATTDDIMRLVDDGVIAEEDAQRVEYVSCSPKHPNVHHCVLTPGVMGGHLTDELAKAVMDLECAEVPASREAFINLGLRYSGTYANRGKTGGTAAWFTPRLSRTYNIGALRHRVSAGDGATVGVREPA